jgi:hypothetical protein
MAFYEIALIKVQYKFHAFFITKSYDEGGGLHRQEKVTSWSLDT